jgi:hypothetical protein
MMRWPGPESKKERTNLVTLLGANVKLKERTSGGAGVVPTSLVMQQRSGTVSSNGTTMKTQAGQELDISHRWSGKTQLTLVADRLESTPRAATGHQETSTCGPLQDSTPESSHSRKNSTGPVPQLDEHRYTGEVSPTFPWMISTTPKSQNTFRGRRWLSGTS